MTSGYNNSNKKNHHFDWKTDKQTNKQNKTKPMCYNEMSLHELYLVLFVRFDLFVFFHSKCEKKKNH